MVVLRVTVVLPFFVFAQPYVEFCVHSALAIVHNHELDVEADA